MSHSPNERIAALSAAVTAGFQRSALELATIKQKAEANEESNTALMNQLDQVSNRLTGLEEELPEMIVQRLELWNQGLTIDEEGNIVPEDDHDDSVEPVLYDFSSLFDAALTQGDDEPVGDDNMDADAAVDPVADLMESSTEEAPNPVDVVSDADMDAAMTEETVAVDPVAVDPVAVETTTEPEADPATTPVAVEAVAVEVAVCDDASHAMEEELEVG